MQFDFEKPAGFNFTPGQYGGFTLINPAETDAGGITRRFSILSTPDDMYLSIAMRIQQSAYKRVLKELPFNSELKFAGPIGTFVLHQETTTPAVLIAGGIGITPFYSMIVAALKHTPDRDITLFYGNQSPADTAFLTELQTLAATHPHFKFIPIMTNPDNSWMGETGYISYQLIKKNVINLSTPIFYICGSATMVNALNETLNELDVPKEHIKVEDFPGY